MSNMPALVLTQPIPEPSMIVPEPSTLGLTCRADRLAGVRLEKTQIGGYNPVGCHGKPLAEGGFLSNAGYRPMDDQLPNKVERFMAELMLHQRRLYQYIYALLPRQQDVEEVMQNFLAVLWKKFDQFDPATNFDALGGPHRLPRGVQLPPAEPPPGDDLRRGGFRANRRRDRAGVGTARGRRDAMHASPSG